MGAETAAREMGRVDLREALDLLTLVAEVAPAKLDGYAPRRLCTQFSAPRRRYSAIRAMRLAPNRPFGG